VKQFKPFKPLERFKQLKPFYIQGESRMAIAYFEDLEIWKSARDVTNKIYSLTNKSAFSKDFGLRDQIRRASVSIMSNIAEGYERGGNQELLQFLSIAKGSCGEVRCQLYVAVDQKYIDNKEGAQLVDHCKKISIMINNFMEYLKRSHFKGPKYKQPVRKSMKEEVDQLMKDLNLKKNNS
jgi:S23 ribosomal protein.